MIDEATLVAMQQQMAQQAAFAQVPDVVKRVRCPLCPNKIGTTMRFLSSSSCTSTNPF
jgi:hypothetical protein